MEEEKPRHERILDRMRSLVHEEVSKFSINGEGGVTAQGGNGNFLISGTPKRAGRNIPTEPDYDLAQPPLKRLPGNKFSLLIGTVNSSIPYIMTDTGYVSIYGDGSSGSIPTIPDDDAEVWAKCTITPVDVFESDPGPPDFDIGNMQVNFVDIVTTAYGVNAVETLATITTTTGAVTPGTYYYWICSILDGEVITVPILTVRLFLPSGFGTATNYGALTTGLYSAGIGNPDPEVTYI